MNGIVTSTGLKVQGAHKFHATVPEFKGRHMWIFVGMWRVDNPAASHQNFDIENLLTVEGPGCFWCEQTWKPTLGAHCPGEPKEQQ